MPECAMSVLVERRVKTISEPQACIDTFLMMIYNTTPYSMHT